MELKLLRGVLSSESIRGMEDQFMKFKFAVLMLALVASAFTFEVAGQKTADSVKTAVLQARHKDDAAGTDNYEYSAFNFLVGQNGPEAKKLTRNNWDVYFYPAGYTGKTADYFDVSMVTDDRSRILDLGEMQWNGVVNLPQLSAYEKPTREEAVEAKLGHIYYVHSADRDSDHYALFRVEELKSGESASLSWKLVGTPAESSK